MFDGEAFGEQMVEVVKAYVDRTTAPLLERIAVLEAAPAVLSEEQEAAIVERVRSAIPEPTAGKDADPEVIRQMVNDAVKALPAPEPGRPGKDVDPALVEQLVKDAVSALPPPAAGKDADPAVIRELVKDAVDAIPKPRDGNDIDPAVVRQLVNEAVAALPAPQPGKDGIGMAGALIDRTGSLVVTLTDGSTRELGQVVGKDADQVAISTQIATMVDAIPKPKDALGFDDMSVTHDGERGFVLRFDAGDRTKEFAFSLPVVLDRGVFKADADYEAGDAVTWGGSLWIAQRSTAAKPGDGEDWRLAVKKGRDGKDLKPA